MDGKICIEIHHGGKFEQVLGMCGVMCKAYNGGKISQFKNIDPDLVSYFEIIGYVKDLGYQDICKLYFKSPLKTMDAGLIFMYNDEQRDKLLEEARETSSIMVYVEHLDAIDIEDGQNVEVPFEVVDTGLGNDVEQEEVSADEDGNEIDQDIEFDDLSDANSMEHCSEDEDEELLSVRLKLLKLKKEMTKLRKESNNQHSEDDEDGDYVPVRDEGYESDLLGSTDCDTPDNSEDEEAAKKPKIHYPVFNPKTEMQDIKFEPGLRFSNPKQLKDAIRNYAVVNGWPIKFKKNNTKQVQVVCKPGCPWTLFASWMSKERSFQIKSMINIHKCPREAKVRMATSSWLAKVYGDKIRSNPTWRCKDFTADVLEKYKMKVSRLQCYRAKKKAMGEVNNGLIKHYSYLRIFKY